MPTRCNLLRPALVVLGIALAVGAFAADGAIYTWVDKQGVTHYSDTPPPGAKPINIKTVPTDTAAVAARKGATQKKLQDAAKQREAAATTDSKAAQQKRANAHACAQAKARVAKLAPLQRARIHESDGTTTYLSGDDFAKYKQQASAQAAKICGTG